MTEKPDTAATPSPALLAVRAINEVRKYILGIAIALAVVTVVLYFFSPQMLRFFQDHLEQKLAFFSVAEPFLAHVKLALIAALFILMPGIIFCGWKAAAKPFAMSAGSIGWFVLFTCLLFYSGAFFCYSITLPFGVRFLLEFQSAQLQPIISIGKFVTFVAVFILAFGIIFELPILMVFGARSGLIPRQSFEKNRRYAILAISIIAALLTPTPDVVNMLLMGVPLYLLYEFGIIVIRILKI
ncbi:MAG: twin-arginine translocase subunit TatC [Proteobacteria bacterium]|nr:twin-arginine translocase subunit TatC [Pseudomonadota bacterium]MBU1738472.1 twin-arginine translocase subunit TatC [Pseudomonadota bacterium]